MKLPFASFEFSGKGARGIVCIVIGVLCLLIVLDVIVNAGRDKDNRSALALVMTALAEEDLSQIAEPQSEGWVYAPEGSFIGNDIKEAQRRAPLRANHFSDLTGTFLGTLLGYSKPDVVGQIKPGDCVRVTDSTVVGFGKTWMHVRKILCPPNPNR